MYRSQRNYGCRIHDQYTYFGMKTLVLENEKVRISILVDKGTEIFEYVYKPTDLDFMWLTENGVQNPNVYLPTSPDPISTFIDYYTGGWQEVFPNGGPTSTYKGTQYGQHGEVAHMPWDYTIEEDHPEQITVRFRVRTKKAPYELTKTMTLQQNSATLIINETLENLSEEPMRFMWGHHLAYGRPFLSEGCRVILPDHLKAIAADGVTEFNWPKFIKEDKQIRDYSLIPPKNTASDIIYLHGFKDNAWYKLENDSLNMGIKVEWDSTLLPYLWYWQEYGATKDYPWYGRHYNIGLEPFAGYPTEGLEQAVVNGSAGSIGPRQLLNFQIKTTPYQI